MLILKKGQVTLTGVERMKERPIGHLISALKGCGVSISAEKDNCYPPIQVQGAETKKMTELFLNCSISSQYLTGILMVAPSLVTGLKINVLNELNLFVFHIKNIRIQVFIILKPMLLPVLTQLLILLLIKFHYIYQI